MRCWNMRISPSAILKRPPSRLCDLFGWHIRWQGEAIHGGMTVHVGSDNSYLALYTPGKRTSMPASSYVTTGGLNHVGIVVDDLDAAEKRVAEAGYRASLARRL